MAAQKNLEANLRRKEQLRRSMGETQAPPWVEDAQEKPLPVYKVPDERLADVGYNVRPQSAPGGYLYAISLKPKQLTSFGGLDIEYLLLPWHLAVFSIISKNR